MIKYDKTMSGSAAKDPPTMTLQDMSISCTDSAALDAFPSVSTCFNQVLLAGPWPLLVETPIPAMYLERCRP